MPEPLFDRYGVWPTEPLAVPDPGAIVRHRDSTRVIVHHTGVGTTMVLDADDKLETERQELGL